MTRRAIFLIKACFEEILEDVYVLISKTTSKINTIIVFDARIN